MPASGFDPSWNCLNYLDETCGGGCETFKFALGNCSCGSAQVSTSSGCDGQICLVATGNPPDCLCDQASFDFFGITVYPQSGSVGGGYQNLNCEGKAGYDLYGCGTYVWEHKIPAHPVFTYCYEDSSGVFSYQIEYGVDGNPIPASCNRFIPIHINTKNHWCDVDWTVTSSASNVTVETEDDDSGGRVRIEIDAMGECVDPPTSVNNFRGGSATKDFCTSCDKCQYRAIITVCGGPQDPQLVLFGLPGNHNGNGSYDPTDFTIPIVPCELKCKTSIVTGIISRGKHQFNLDFQKSFGNNVPEGSYTELDIRWIECWNECEICKCGILEDDNMFYEWNDFCFNYSGINRNGVLTYNEEHCMWETPPLYISGYDRTAMFALVCKEHCCQQPSGFPFKPKNLSDDSHDIYLYEFYKTGTGLVDWNDDYYIWKKTSECNPINFERAWKKCDGVVSEESLGCEHSFKIYSDCISGTPCDTCNISVYIYGEENHLALEGWYQVYKNDYVIQDGEVGREGYVAIELPSGDQPWYFVYSGHCYDPVSGLINCDDTPFTLYAPTATGCVVHSGSCTLCYGEAFSKSLWMTDNFGEVNLNWDTTSWIGSQCVYLESCYNEEDSTCVNGSGYQTINYELMCYKSGWRLDVSLPYRNCGCGGGCSCNDTPLPMYTNPDCTSLILMSGCDSSARNFTLLQESGNFNWDCDPLEIEVFIDVNMSGSCGLLYQYEGVITE